MRDSHYAVEATAVREVIPLPEIYPLEETPSYLVGVVNLRGRIVPIIDLLRRFGHSSSAYSIMDSILVLEHTDKIAGILVHDVQIVDVDQDALVATSAYATNGNVEREAPFLRGVVKWGDKVAMRLNLENILEIALNPSLSPDGFSTSVIESHYTEEEKAVLRARAHHLAQPADEEELDGKLALAVVRLGQEFFGVELHTIREFVDLKKVAPIPCCPPHIVGQISLRGDLITVTDISNALGLPPKPNVENRKLMVLQEPGLAAGVIVDEILNVLFLPAAVLDAIPAINRHIGDKLGREYLRGTTPYGSRTVTILDLPALLKHESLHVNETLL